MVDIIVRRYKNGDASAICEIIKKTWKNEENGYTNSWQRSSSGSAWKSSTLNAPFSFNINKSSDRISNQIEMCINALNNFEYEAVCGK